MRSVGTSWCQSRQIAWLTRSQRHWGLNAIHWQPYDENGILAMATHRSAKMIRDETMNFRFNFEKTLQAAGVLLHLEEKRMSRLRLLKFLDIADRELLAEAAHPITGDVGCAMKYGPVLSRVYDLIKGTGPRRRVG